MSIDIHDYLILALEIEDDKTLVIKLSDPLGAEHFELVLTGVQSLYVDGFSMQNIILDMGIFFERDESFEFQRACVLLEIDPACPHGMSDSSCIVFVQASAGAEVACLINHHWEPRLTRIEISDRAKR